MKPPFISAIPTNATSTSLDGILSVISDLGVVAILALVIYGGFRRWWVFSWIYTDLLDRHEKLREDRDKWQALALRASNLAEIIAEQKKGV